MNTQLREKKDPHELDNPIPYSVSAIILGLTLWAVSYIYWTTDIVQESEKAVKMQNTEKSSTLITEQKIVPQENTKVTAKTATNKKSTTVNGKALYAANCSGCHQATGQGLPGVFPPLNKSIWVTSDNVDLPIQIIAKGLMGKVNVAGTEYNGVMPAFSASLSADELAGLITYIRQSWDNKASTVSTEAVQQSMDKHNSQSAPWSGESQLLDIIGKAK